MVTIDKVSLPFIPNYDGGVMIGTYRLGKLMLFTVSPLSLCVPLTNNEELL
tara:strand:+ start:1320 stop:1472 length:153 start_codon:yes stop_codon:yes gene_type:complete